jgi:hypothetical protein
MAHIDGTYSNEIKKKKKGGSLDDVPQIWTLNNKVLFVLLIMDNVISNDSAVGTRWYQLLSEKH